MYYRFEIIDLLPYLLLYTCCLYFSIRNKKNDYLFVGLFLFLFSAFRYGIGYDFFAYTRLIEGTASYRDIEWISQLGFDPQFGARPLKRVIQRKVLNELSKMILSGNIQKDAEIVLDFMDNKLVFFNKTK